MSKLTLTRNVEIAMRDGTILRADVTRMEEGEPQPVLLVRTVYDKDRSGFAPWGGMAKKGFALVVQDCRGGYASEGEWTGLRFAYDADDGYDTVEWLAAQPWCNGQVVMTGVSGLGMTTLLAAAARPPHLVAVAPWQISDASLVQREHGGGFEIELLTSWLLAQIAWMGLPKALAAGEATMEDVAKVADGLANIDRVTGHLPIANNPWLDVPGAPITIAELLATSPFPLVDFGAIEVPTQLLGGWYDLFPLGTVEMWRILRERGGPEHVRKQHRLVMGPWIHGSQFPFAGELHFGLTAIAEFEMPMRLAGFLSHHAGLGEENVAPVRYFLMRANEWREADDWPPPGVESRELFLDSDGSANTASGDGRLETGVPSAAGSDRYRYDPADPVRNHGGKLLYLGTGVPGPFDQGVVERREDVLCYTSEPFSEPVDVVGNLALTLWAASSARDTDFVAKVCDVFPDGRSINVVEGIRRARFRKGYDREILLTPGEVDEYSIELGPTAWRVEPGHRLRVQICSSFFPHIDRNMNTGNPVGSDAAGIVAEQTIHHSLRFTSRLHYQVLPCGDGRRESN